MRTHSRARRLALTALCAGTSIGAAGLATMPGQALAAKTSCSNLWGSGSTLQTALQQNTFAAKAANGGAFKNCGTNVPSVFYNLKSDGVTTFGTGSGAGLTEFALQGSPAAITPSKSSNGSWLDGFIGTDDPPSASAMSNAAGIADSHPEVVPVFSAPVAIIVNLPAGCTTKTQPKVTNNDLSAVFDGNLSWNALLTDAGASPSKGCKTAGNPTIDVRYDGSGTSYATKQYFSQIDPNTWTSQYVTDGTTGSTASTWPAPVATTYVDQNGVTQNNQGSPGEANAVLNTDGSIGYVNTADAVNAGFGNWKSGADTFWVEVQNNGTSTSGKVTAAQPITSKNKGACPTNYVGEVPSGDEPDWTGVHDANPSQPSASNYPLCTFTYDVAWQTYVNSSVLAPDYTGQYSGETPAGVETTVKDYLGWVVNSTKGQALTPNYYSPLPTNVASAAVSIVKNEVGIN
jgi:hypothetical protein